MSKISEVFESLSKKNEAALITYLTAGYPTLDASLNYIKTLAQYSDMIEIGVPFSDPIADGKTIQFSSQIALKSGVNLVEILKRVARLDIKKPIILLSYLNPLIALGIEESFRKMQKARIAGLIVPDLVIEESELLKELALKYSIDLIHLVAPTSDKKRIKLIGEATKGFVYCVSVTGTTGVRKKLPYKLLSFISLVKSIVQKPVAVGFGISHPGQIKKLSKVADGIIIGSRIIEIIRNREDLNFHLKRFKQATMRG